MNNETPTPDQNNTPPHHHQTLHFLYTFLYTPMREEIRKRLSCKSLSINEKYFLLTKGHSGLTPSTSIFYGLTRSDDPVDRLLFLREGSRGNGLWFIRSTI